MIFKVCKNSLKMKKVRGTWSPRQISGEFQGGSASRAVVLGRVFRAVLQVLGQVLQNNLTRLAPPSKDGVGGFKGLCPTRRPQIAQNPPKCQKYKEY